MIPVPSVAGVARRLAILALAGLVVACGSSPPTAPSTPKPPTVAPGLSREQIVSALDYWRDAVGITYVLVDTADQPRLLIRSGRDGLAAQGGGRGGVDGTSTADNRILSGLVVIEPDGGTYCRNLDGCRYLYRHEIGHALGFLGHSGQGLMQSSLELTSRERAMVTTLYSLPFGARVEPDGRWSVPSAGLSGQINDLQVARDIMDWNVNAAGSSSARQPGVICRWELPVRVYIQP